MGGKKQHREGEDKVFHGGEAKTIGLSGANVLQGMVAAAPDFAPQLPVEPKPPGFSCHITTNN
jgi:hypothetical protein